MFSKPCLERLACLFSRHYASGPLFRYTGLQFEPQSPSAPRTQQWRCDYDCKAKMSLAKGGGGKRGGAKPRLSTFYLLSHEVLLFASFCPPPLSAVPRKMSLCAKSVPARAPKSAQKPRCWHTFCAKSAFLRTSG